MASESVEETPLLPDDVREAMLTSLSEALGDALVESYLRPHEDLWLRVRADRWQDVAQTAKSLGYTYFGFLSAIDWEIAPEGRYENTEFDGELEEEDSDPVVQSTSTGYAGGDTRFQVIVQLQSPTEHTAFHLKTDVGEDNSIDTLRDIYAGADWHEREIHEMFGIGFRGHPNLHPLYLPGEFEGHPLRKDFPLLARHVKPWPGVVDIEDIPEHLEAELEAQVMAAFEAAGGGE